MKRTLTRTARVALIAAFALVLMTATAFAVGKVFSLGPFAHYTQSEVHTMEDIEAFLEEHRAEWQGKVYDEGGNPIDDLAQYIKNNRESYGIYDAQGIALEMDVVGNRMVLNPIEPDDMKTTRFATLEEVQPYVAFPVVLPSHLPDGYQVDRYELFDTYDGEPSKQSKYLMVAYSMSDTKSEMYLQLRLMDEETAYEAGVLDSAQAATINGNEAVIDGGAIDMLVGDIMYMFLPSQSGVSVDELLRMAESVGK